MKAEITIDIQKVPEILACMRRELAHLLRVRACECPRAVGDKLVEIAADFEIGLTR